MKGDYYRYLAEVATGDARNSKYSPTFVSHFLKYEIQDLFPLFYINVEKIPPLIFFLVHEMIFVII